jgi:uncharacterized protein
VSGAPVVLTGATGLVGSALAKRLRAEGRALRLVSRSPGRIAAEPGVEAVGWDGISLAAEALDGAGAVVHLAGESIFGGLPTRARRERIWASRIDSTKALVQRLAELPAGRRPSRLVCASAVGYYGDRGEEELTDASPHGTGFLADLCVAWEAEARRAAELGVRVVSLRFGVVLSRAGGALAALARLFGLGLGGRIGDGRQWFSWIHLDDVVSLAQRALDDVDFTGAFAAVAPVPVRNEAFTRALARVLHRPALLPAPAFAVRLALGELAGELLGSRRVLPARAQALGHRFAHPELSGALAAELRRD